MNPSSAHIASIRQDYLLASLNEQDLNQNPIIQFQQWFQEAVNAEIDDVNAMTLCTVDANNHPHARIVLLKGVEANQFIFFTNYQSHKGQQLANNPHASLVFHWKELQRQIRIEGKVEKVSEADSIDYFSSRPKESQLGAWASQQSEVLHSRAELEQRFNELKNTYANTDVPKPSHWGGYAISPSCIEFWQGRSNRLHDRFCYTLENKDNWVMNRLNP